MKNLKRIKIKLYLFFTVALFSLNMYSQDIPLVNKIVGNGDANNYYIGHFPVFGSDGLDIHWYGGIRFGDGINSAVMNIKNGRVGIGTNQPTSPLSIGDNHGVKLSIGNSAWQNTSVIETGYSEQTGDFTDIKAASYGYSNGVVRILQNGNVGIGTGNPTSKLTVAGNIASREVKVTVDAGADFVFDNKYNLPSLESVDKFIKENKHLPEIASAQEMQKDGINLSEMNIKLLQKIEEMTLYMIEQERINKSQSLQIENLKKGNETFKTVLERLTKLEEKLK